MATTPEELTDGKVTISESDNDVDGKYLLIQVPDFATDPSGDPDGVVAPARFGKGMTSFLRLGAASLDPEPGDDLVQYVYQEGAGPVGFTGSHVLKDKDGNVVKDKAGNPVTLKTAFIDDERNRGDGGVEPLEADGHGMNPEQRHDWHTKHLLTKGGWRDHSDGNRITTTYGDKVEVIRGNYKLIVLGRQNEAGNAQGHEWSGNHVQDWGQGTMPGASVTLEWIQSGYVPGAPILKTKDDPKDEDEFYLGGAWLLINSTERVYQYSRNAGDFRTQQWGEKLESYVGSEDPERIGTTPGVGYKGHPTAAEIADYHKVLDDDDLVEKLRPDSVGLPRGNPHILEKTWAVKIESYTGSEAWKIPDMYEETWATLSKTRTHVNTSDEESWFKTSRSVTHADEINEETHAGSVTSKAYVGAQTEFTAVGAATSMTTAASITDLTFVGAKTDITIAANQFELSAGLHESIEIAAMLDVFLGLKLEITAALGLDINFGGQISINCASSTEFNIGPKLAIDSTSTTKLTPFQSNVSAFFKLIGANVQIG